VDHSCGGSYFAGCSLLSYYPHPFSSTAWHFSFWEWDHMRKPMQEEHGFITLRRASMPSHRQVDPSFLLLISEQKVRPQQLFEIRDFANISTGGTPTRTWAFRACVIQGTQQIYVALLWYWGSSLTRLSTNGVASSSLITSSSKITGITTPIAFILWVVGAVLFFGLPNYYRQKPGKVPSFYSSLVRRKIVLVSCFLSSQILFPSKLLT
jgi:hypothetical protein